MEAVQSLGDARTGLVPHHECQFGDIGVDDKARRASQIVIIVSRDMYLPKALAKLTWWTMRAFTVDRHVYQPVFKVALTRMWWR